MEKHVLLADLETSDQVWNDILEIANTSGRNDKIALLQKAKEKDNSLFKWTLKMVLDNTVNFRIKVRKEEFVSLANTQGAGKFDTAVSHFLTLLSIGTYTRAQALIELKKFGNKLSFKSFSLLVAIINKDLAAGINTSTVNKVFKGLIPTFPYMRCSLPTQVDLRSMGWELGVYAQEKADGMFVNINTNLDGVELLSRQGTIIPTTAPEFEYLSDVLPRGFQIHGEMLVVDPSDDIAPREIGNGIINSYVKSGTRPDGWAFVFHVWDAIPLQYVTSKGRYTEPYHSRYQTLSNHIKKAMFRRDLEKGHERHCLEMIETRMVYSIEEAMAFYRHMLMCGKEGAVLKESSAIWRDGTSKEQVKLKLICDCDLVVTGFDEGEGKFSDNLGSVTCQSSDGELIVNVSGFTDKVRREIWDNRDKYLGAIMTVRFNDVLQKEGSPASLFLPRFVEFRTDKIEADSLERVIETKERAVNA